MITPKLKRLENLAREMTLFGNEPVSDHHLDFSKDADYDDSGKHPFVFYDELVEWRNDLAVIGQALKLLRAAVDDEIADRLGDGGSARFGDTVYRVYPAGRWKAHDPKGLALWVSRGNEDLAQRIHAVYGGSIRVTAIRALAEAEDTISGQAVVETFLERVKEEPKLHALPLDRAPPWLQKLQEGEVRNDR